MLRNIKLTHFKCFEELSLDCAPLNLLCGLNGMGKSTVIQALLVLRQSAEIGELGKGRLALAGERVDIGTSTDVLFEDAEEDVLSFALTSDEVGGLRWQQAFDCPRVSDRMGGFAVPAAKGRVAHLWQNDPPFGGLIIYVNAERVGPRKFYPLSDLMARRSDFGEGSEHAWSYLSRSQDLLLKADDPRCAGGGGSRLLNIVDHWLQEVCPGAHLQLEAVPDADAVIAGFQFDRPGDVRSRRYRAVNVGFGLSYTLPVIVALLSPPRTLCLIENPEAHLHPRGQTKLAELAATAANAGVQVFAETHSDHFMDGVRIAIRDGLIDAENVAFHYFERPDNRSTVTSLKADSDGRLSHWPQGFFDQHEDNLTRLIAPRP